MRFETLAVHAGGERDTATGSIAPPLHLSTTYEHGPAGEVPRGWMYIREGNPTQDRLEEALAAVEGGQARPGVRLGPGGGDAAYLQALPAGSHVIFPTTSTTASGSPPSTCRAGGWRRPPSTWPTWRRSRPRSGPSTRLVWAETPSNPLMKIVDLAALAGARARRRRAACSSTGPSLRRRSSGRSSSARMPSSTRRRSTSAATATCRAARSSSRSRGAGREGRRTRATPRRRGVALQLLARAARPAVAGLPGGAALLERPGSGAVARAPPRGRGRALSRAREPSGA